MRLRVAGSRRGRAGCLAVFGLAGAAVLSADSVPRGQEIFETKCSKCHALDKDEEGPRLRGVFGRPAASVPSFQYSDALKNSKFTWNETLLNTWLTDPDKMVPDTDMSFHLDSASDRKAVIDYLKSLAGR
ncbi:MAG TPA: c-type cytochrome [Bryobacteraceae bacterium]|nr:c-type cytochrome [Bryobacteraceae bacterium]